MCLWDLFLLVFSYEQMWLCLFMIMCGAVHAIVYILMFCMNGVRVPWFPVPWIYVDSVCLRYISCVWVVCWILWFIEDIYFCMWQVLCCLGSYCWWN